MLKRFGYLLDKHTLSGFPELGFNLPFYVSKYHVRRDDTLSDGVLCDSPLGSVIRVTNIFESIFGSTDHAANKNACPWILLDCTQCPIDKNYLFVLGHSGDRLTFMINYVNPTFVFLFVNQ